MDKCHLPGVVEVENASFSTPWSYASFLYEITKNELASYFVALSCDRVAGYGGIHLVSDEGQITNIAVLPKFRGQQIGKALLSRLMKEARQENMSKIFLEVASRNTIAISLYKNAGFFEVGRRKNYYTAPPDDALILTYIIK